MASFTGNKNGDVEQGLLEGERPTLRDAGLICVWAVDGGVVDLPTWGE